MMKFGWASEFHMCSLNISYWCVGADLTYAIFDFPLHVCFFFPIPDPKGNLIIRPLSPSTAPFFLLSCVCNPIIE